MTVVVDTHVEAARTLVETERDAVDAKLSAFEAFIDRVRDVSAEPSRASSTRATTVAGAREQAGSPAGSGCRQVRAAFAETVRPHSVDDPEAESLLETVRAEFTEEVAVALAPTTDASFTPALRQLVLGEADARRAETEALQRVLASEAQQLADAADVVEAVTGWIADADETPLTALGFDELADRHEALSSQRARCEALARHRQSFLDDTSNNGSEVGVRHRSVCPYIYGALPVDHPVLASVARLDATCADCQRAVREHLVRRA